MTIAAGNTRSEPAMGSDPTRRIFLGESDTADVLGRATALTNFNTVKPIGVPILRALFLVGTYVPQLTVKLRRLSFIHFARWTFFKRIPQNGEPQRSERLRYRYLLFETNYNGSFDDYIDSFSYIVAGYMRGIWGTSFGFPGPVPPQPFKEYILKNELPLAHYYVAYPDASTTMVQSAQRVRRRSDTFTAETADLAPEDFAAAYRRFVRANQRDL